MADNVAKSMKYMDQIVLCIYNVKLLPVEYL
jgi:hypothetical protein